MKKRIRISIACLILMLSVMLGACADNTQGQESFDTKAESYTAAHNEEKTVKDEASITYESESVNESVTTLEQTEESSVDTEPNSWIQSETETEGVTVTFETETETNTEYETESDTIAEEETDTDSEEEVTIEIETEAETETETVITLDNIPEFSGLPYIEVNDNQPFFSFSEITIDSFEFYSSIDSLGRCGYAFSCIGIDLMPTEPRGDISSVMPSGWQSVTYSIVEGGYLYNRCHLIGFQLTGENANASNLITGTRYLNIKGMLPFENMVADYVKETENHVMYRVTPIFEGDELLARGVLIEGFSVEDGGEGICFNVYCYNVQPGIEINYADGESCLAEGEESGTEERDCTYIFNTSSHKFHCPSCSAANTISEKNKEYFYGTREEAIALGYTPCGICKP